MYDISYVLLLLQKKMFYIYFFTLFSDHFQTLLVISNFYFQELGIE